MVSKGDWRRNGQEKYLTNAVLIFVNDFKNFSDKWDHEHCEFCFEKFSPAESPLTALPLLFEKGVLYG